jgi:hypothetical protein
VSSPSTKGGSPYQGQLVADMAKATGVSEADVAKVLDTLGLSRILTDVVNANNGKEPPLSAAKIGFKIGRATVVI